MKQAGRLMLPQAFGLGCGCCAGRVLRQRRLFTVAGMAALAGGAWPAWAREGVDVGKESTFTKLVSAEQVESAATQQYACLLYTSPSPRD